MNESTVYAEDVNYWKTSQSAADTWIEKSKKELDSVNGRVLSEAYGSDATGKAAFMLAFQIGDDQFKVMWPVLQSKTGNLKAAKIQAATMLYHDIKARCMAAKVLGARASFVGYLLLPDGRTTMQVSTQELTHVMPSLFLPIRTDKGHEDF
jgi:hypothetical protein